MSDSKSSHGEPVEEPRGVDDVVGSANEGLSEAEAAREQAGDAAAGADATDAGTVDSSAARESAAAHDAARDDPAADDTANDPASADHANDVHNAAPDGMAGEGAEEAADTGAHAAPADSASDDFDASKYHGYLDDEPSPPPAYTAPDAATTAYPTADAPTTAHDTPDAATTAYGAPDAPTTAYGAPLVTPSEPISEAPVVAGAAGAVVAGPRPIFVQAPEAPTPRGNRGAAGAIGLLAALAFGVLYLAAWLGFGLLSGDVTGENLGATALGALTTWSLWVPIVVFFIAFWLLGAIINRGRWGAWVIFGLLVGIASYGGHILGALFQAPFWMLTASEGGALVEAELLAPLAIAAFVIGRELTIWFGAWAAARGARVTELNIEAQREYERTLEAGPQLVQH